MKTYRFLTTIRHQMIGESVRNQLKINDSVQQNETKKHSNIHTCITSRYYMEFESLEPIGIQSWTKKSRFNLNHWSFKSVTLSLSPSWSEYKCTITTYICMCAAMRKNFGRTLCFSLLRLCLSILITYLLNIEHHWNYAFCLAFFRSVVPFCLFVCLFDAEKSTQIKNWAAAADAVNDAENRMYLNIV